MNLAPAAPRPRAAVLDLPAYVAGLRASSELTAALSSNESHYPPLPSVLEEVLRSAATLNRYPDNGAVELRERIALALGVSPQETVVGAGSTGVLQQIVSAVCDPGDEVVMAWRSFEAYPILVRLAGAVPVLVPLDAHEGHDLAAMAAAITPRTRLVLVCTPNNPTGVALGHAELAAFLDRVPAHVLVVIDEAYLEYADPAAPTGPTLVGPTRPGDPAAPTYSTAVGPTRPGASAAPIDSPGVGLTRPGDSAASAGSTAGGGRDVLDAVALFRAHPNVCLLRTFSKAHGLASLRVGYAVAAAPMADGLRRAGMPFAVSTLAQRAAIASLDAHDEMHERVGLVRRERARVIAAVRELGYTTPAGQANFIWLRLDDDARERTLARLAEHDILARGYADAGVRISLADPTTNDRVLTALATLAPSLATPTPPLARPTDTTPPPTALAPTLSPPTDTTTPPPASLAPAIAPPPSTSEVSAAVAPRATTPTSAAAAGVRA
ncbi:aminotransferase class I/II-fold pyridoxal phosphate-dependent enzyme [Herbiconiux sp. P15]|uniref:aminotransferase class I/II-fold pyridoxal phosphate-dependent enzyme n=1 Tax=Herbiconiux liukaitaii TaxID=3342799 RepID=UPI0035B77302